MMNKTVCYYLDVSSLCDEEIYNRALKTIIRQERLDAIERYRFMKDKRLSLGVGLLMQHTLRLAGVRNMELKYGKNGKPFLANNEENVFFNCSHSEDVAVCAVSDREVGVDVEKVAPFDKRIITGFFTPEEQARIKGDEQEFYRFWTRKESYLKYLGSGMTVSPQNICVLEKTMPGENCVFTEFSKDGYCFCVCGNKCTDFVKLTTEEILL